ncbi:hypothetical protein [Bradyrhizobium sp. 144]|uniref:hypothetical protein n=1 Tax=Bradyrhizobium sp. 144 TaxID=2782620 RepID=UPI001FFB3321|nr:hypothetical protein [Bradyrhizobium sp. 144]MCK1693679.1 hypothetical protein [Bradyrhizobium sp. 144]
MALFVTFVIWLVLCICIAAAASERGREGPPWFFLAFFFSPLIAAVLLAVFPNLKQEQLMRQMAASARPPALPPPLPQGPFEPDGIYAGIPYRVTADAAIEAIIQGATVRFRDFDRFTSAFKDDLFRGSRD